MGLEKLTGFLDALCEQRGIPGCDCVVYRAHETVYRHMCGFSDEQKTQPLKGNEVYWLYSTTKLITCAAALQLIEKGKLDLDDPVARYLPAFTLLTVAEGDLSRAAQSVLTVRHLMSMQGGLDYDLNARAIQVARESYGAQATTRQLVDAMAHKPLQFDPGADFAYSLCHDVLAAVVEVVSGMRFSDYLQKYIFDPLDMRTVGYRLTPERRARLCAQFARDEATGQISPIAREYNEFVLSDSYESGGAGLLSDLRDYALFADALANGGVGRSGARILRPESIDLWRAPVLTGASRASFDLLGHVGYNYALGVQVLDDPAAVGARASAGQFGWDGAAGAYAAIDPANRLAIVYVQHVRFCGPEWPTAVQPMLRELVYEGLDL